MSYFLGSIVFKALIALSYIINWTPRFIKYFIEFFLGRLWFYVFRFRQRIILINLSLVIHKDTDESIEIYKKRLKNILKENLKHMISIAFDAIEALSWSRADFKKKIIHSGEEYVEDYYNNKKGCFLMTAHMGNWEIANIVGCYLGFPLSSIARDARGKVSKVVLQKFRDYFDYEHLTEKNSAFKIIKAVKKGRVIGFMMDQFTFPPHAVDSEFLGIKTFSPKGMALLSLKLKAPVLPVLFLKKKDQFIVRILPALDFDDILEKNMSEEQKITAHVNKCNQVLGEFILEDPVQYNWMHKRFKTTIDYGDYQLPWE